MEWIVQFDYAMLQSVARTFHSALLDYCMPAITHIGDNGILWIVVAATFLYSKRYRKIAIILIAALLLAYIACNLLIKPLVARERPFDLFYGISLLIKPPVDLSFPSGHACSSFAALTVLYTIEKKLRIPAAIYAFLIAFSRVYLLVHFPLDVIAGELIGIACGSAALLLFKRNIILDMDSEARFIRL